MIRSKMCLAVLVLGNLLVFATRAGAVPPWCLVGYEYGSFAGNDSVLGDRFGQALDLDGDRIVVGAPTANGNFGAAYIFVRQGNTWVQETELDRGVKVPGPGNLGGAVAINGDWAFVGEPSYDTTSTGAVWIFRRNPFNNTWLMTQLLDTFGENDQAGNSLASDGDRLFVGRPGGQFVNIYTWTGTTWGGGGEVWPIGGGDHTGYAADHALAASGNFLVVGGYEGAYIYQRYSNGFYQMSWAIKLLPDDFSPGSGFGRAVDVEGLGSGRGSAIVVVGAMNDDAPEQNSGSAYVFFCGAVEYQTICCTELAKLTAWDGGANTYFGTAVSVSGDYIAVGSGWVLGGAVYVFQREDGGTPNDPLDDQWVPHTKLTGSDSFPDDSYGFRVAASNGVVAIGAHHYLGGSGTGKVYVSLYGPDPDEDQIVDACDNCPANGNANQADGDNDGLGDVCDSCPSAPAPSGVDATGRPLGDFDEDCDVDLSDFVIFAGNFTG